MSNELTHRQQFIRLAWRLEIKGKKLSCLCPKVTIWLHAFKKFIQSVTYKCKNHTLLVTQCYSICGTISWPGAVTSCVVSETISPTNPYKQFNLQWRVSSVSFYINYHHQWWQVQFWVACRKVGCIPWILFFQANMLQYLHYRDDFGHWNDSSLVAWQPTRVTIILLR